MNEHDRRNLEFLLNVDKQTLKNCFERMSPDDIEYAWELLEMYNNEINEAVNALRIDAELENLMFREERFPEANAVLAKFRLKK